MEKKFIKLVEANITRATRGGFLVGDYVEFKKGYKSHPEYKELADHVKDAIQDLIKSKFNIRVISVNDETPARYLGNPENINGKVVLVIHADMGGGRRHGENVIIPSCLVTKIDHYPNLAPFPDEVTYQNKEIHTPEEVKPVDGGLKGGTYSLPTKNTKLPQAKKSKSYTASYLDGLK
jgi:hypothetical protein